MANNTDINHIVNEDMRNDLLNLRDAITLYIKKYNCSINTGEHYKIVLLDVNKTLLNIDNAIYALNIAIAKKE